jgi:hypothetical protein
MGENTDAEVVERSNNKIKNYFVKHWKGELSLAKSFWVNVILLHLFFTSIQVYLRLISEKNTETQSVQIYFATLILFIIKLCFAPWQIWGAWLSADNYSGPKIWPLLAKLVLFLSALNVLRALTNLLQFF